jgi:hypothetical protein
MISEAQTFLTTVAETLVMVQALFYTYAVPRFIRGIRYVLFRKRYEAVV